MDILKLIKTRRSIRRYQDKPLTKEEIDKILEAGIWGPSITTFLRIQPWQFVVISDKKLIKEIYEIVLKKSKKAGIGVNILLHSAANTINTASVLIAVYNTGDLKKIRVRYKEIYTRFSKLAVKAELSAISAAIQNMILVAEDLGIGSCWLDIPLFCEKDINKFVDTNDELVALLTFGYPAEQPKPCVQYRTSALSFLCDSTVLNSPIKS